MWGGCTRILTPERVRAAVPGEGGCSRTAEMGPSQRSLRVYGPHPPALSPRTPHHTREEVEKTAWGRGEGGLNLFCSTLAETIWAEDMDAMLWRALSLETWS